MKKGKSDARASSAKGNDDAKAVDEYLAAVAETRPHQFEQGSRNDSLCRASRRQRGRQLPTFNYKGPLMGFAAFSNHCSLFPMNGSVIEVFKKGLKSASPLTGLRQPLL